MEDIFEQQNDLPLEIGVNHPFSYESLARAPWKDYTDVVNFNDYKVYVLKPIDNNYLRLERSENYGSQLLTLADNKKVDEGWKLHMSIFDPSNENKNLAKAWSIVVQTSMEYDIKLVKVIKNELRDKMRSSDKNGKEITWYYFKDDLTLERVKAYLTTLTVRFRDHGIIPGQLAKHDKYTIDGSNYFGYYDDSGEKINSPDPFRAIKIEVPNQPQRHLDDIPKRISMEDSANLDSEEYNNSEADSSKCSNCCPW